MTQDDARSVVVRKMTQADEPSVLELMRVTLGWNESDPNREFFRWKHVENPFGRSPAWVAEVDDEVVGFRTFMRWRFRTCEGSVDAVRAVDTATHPSFQGKGIFKTLTLHAVGEMTAEGVSFVFNTPNDQSRPGYLKMGWTTLGRLPIAALISGASGAVHMLTARAAAALWSLESTVGEDAADVFSDTRAAAALIEGSSPHDLSTERSPEFLRWRYGFPALNYRVLVSPSGLEGGAIVFRLRRRGGAVEAAVCDILAPSRSAWRSLVRQVLRLTDADYAISLGSRCSGLPLYGQGPLLTYRALARTESAPLDRWDLALGDIELF